MFFYWIRTKDKKVFLERLLYTDSFPARENLRQKNYLYCIGNFSTFWNEAVKLSSSNCEAFNSVFTKADFK